MSHPQPTPERYPSIPFASKPTVQIRPPLQRSAGVAAVLCLALGAASCSDEGTDTPAPTFPSPMTGVMDNLPSEGTTPPAADPTESMVGVQPPGEGMDEGLGLDTPDDSMSGGSDAPAIPPAEETPPVPEPALQEPIELPPVECTPLENPGALGDADINVDLSTELQRIRGFGGMNMVRWIGDLTPEQVQTAFGDGPGQLGLSILRIGISQNPDDFVREVPTAQHAVALGAQVMATPWTPPPNLKTNNDVVGGELAPENYGAYADHLLAFRDFMAESGVPLEAISIQNEPDITVTYDSCDWTSAQMADFLTEQGPRFGDTKVIAAESFNFNRQVSDPLLNDPAVAAEFDIVGGHIYGNGLADYPLARQRGKEVWMTEHYTDSGAEPDRANFWPLAYDVATEIHNSMQANFNAYVWWYIRRGYGLITEDGLVSKRGYLMSQFSRFIRPGYVRVAASDPGANVDVTAYKNGPGSVVVVALNPGQAQQTVNLDIFGSCVTGFDRFTTSETKNVQDDGPVALDNGRLTVSLDPQSVTTFVSQPIVTPEP
jgi:O-glycosyl hydrolase